MQIYTLSAKNPSNECTLCQSLFYNDRNCICPVMALILFNKCAAVICHHVKLQRLTVCFRTINFCAIKGIGKPLKKKTNNRGT